MCCFQTVAAQVGSMLDWPTSLGLIEVSDCNDGRPTYPILTR